MNKKVEEKSANGKHLEIIANILVKELQSEVKEKNKKVAESAPYYRERSVFIESDKKYDEKSAKYRWYIRVGKKQYVNFESLAQLSIMEGIMLHKLNELKRTSRTFKNLQITCKDVSEGGWNGRAYSLIEKVMLPDNPCKEFKSLQNYVSKYGHTTIPNYTLYSCYGGGKRGYLYGEEGDRFFLDNKPKKCARVLAEIRKARGSKDTITCRFGREEYIDPIDKKYSQYHEVECDGEYRNYLQVVIQSPTGKVKYDEKIY